MRFRLDELGTELKEIVPRMHFCVGGREIPEDKGGIDSNKYCLPVTWKRILRDVRAGKGRRAMLEGHFNSRIACVMGWSDFLLPVQSGDWGIIGIFGLFKFNLMCVKEESSWIWQNEQIIYGLRNLKRPWGLGIEQWPHMWCAGTAAVLTMPSQQGSVSGIWKAQRAGRNLLLFRFICWFSEHSLLAVFCWILL